MNLIAKKIIVRPCCQALLHGFIGAFVLLAGPARAASPEDSEKSELEVNNIIIHHVVDSHSWHFFDGPYGTLHLPVIVYSADRGWDIFSSARFYDEAHKPVDYKGYRLSHGRIYRVHADTLVVDLSITKNVAMLMLTATLLTLLLRAAAIRYRTDHKQPPKGLQAFLEPVILFVTEEIIKPNAGPHYRRYTPYLLTLFFFILLGNILGLLPGAANLTGNIAVTMTLALFTFFITNLSGNKNYWVHVFWTPGVPMALRPVLIMVEFIGLFTKPFALMIRLFAAITAGHIVILSLIAMTFIFGSYIVGAGVSVFLTLINLVEILVAVIQAYVFTLFSSLYIGMATEEKH